MAGSPYAITPSAATGGTFDIANYTPSYVHGALTVTPAPLTVTADDGSKVYGDVYSLVGTPSPRAACRMARPSAR